MKRSPFLNLHRNAISRIFFNVFMSKADKIQQINKECFIFRVFSQYKLK